MSSDYFYYGGALNPNYGSGIFAAIMTVIVAYWLIFLFAYAVVAVPKWFLYEKAGQPGWAALVPFYKDYVMFDISWGNGVLFLLLLIPFANAVIWIITWVKLAEAFGKGGGWACGLIFLNIIFLYIMAFSSDVVYVGAPGKTPPNSYGGGQAGCGGPYGQPGYQNPGGQPGYRQPYGQGAYRQPYGQPGQAGDAQNGSRQSPGCGVKYCPGCGTALKIDDKFCPKCGRAQ